MSGGGGTPALLQQDNRTGTKKQARKRGKAEKMANEKRENYKRLCEEYRKSPYRRNQEYGDYLHRFFYSDSIVDGKTPESRADALPMPYNKYFG